MLLDLIEHQKELFAAIIAPMSYWDLNALRETCRVLFMAVSDDHRWQHMHSFGPTLECILLIERAILRRDNGIETTIICNGPKQTYYRIERSILHVGNNDSSINTIDVKGQIHYRYLEWFGLCELSCSYEVPDWLSIAIGAVADYWDINCETVIDLRP
jgi:hypothetical protein